MNNEQRITQLESQVRDLLAWKDARTRQQLTFPLDKVSKDIVSKDMFVWNGTIADVPPNLPGFMCYLNGKLWAVQVVDPTIYE